MPTIGASIEKGEQFMELVNDRAMLRLMHVNDNESLFTIVEGNKGIQNYLTVKIDSYQDMEQYVQVAIKGFEGETDLPFVVVDQKTNEIVGSTRLYSISNDNKTVESGQTWYHPSVHRTSINTECKYMLLQHAFEELHMLRV